MMAVKPAKGDNAYREFYIETVTHAWALEALGYDVKTLNSTMTTLFTTKMPNDIRLQLQR